MTFDISKLKKISNSTISTINEKENQTNKYVDDRFWKIERDNDGNGMAMIRILPSIREGELPFTSTYNYFIKGPNGWYIEDSLRTINKQDPMAEYIASRWAAAETDRDKQLLRQSGLSKARHQYIANILVIKDPNHPENQGKVFLWKFGQKIYDMIVDKARPVFEGDAPINVTDWDEGCNFRLVVYTKDKFPSYDRSSFDAPSKIGSDENIIAIANKMYDLGEFTDPTKFKSYEELKAKVDRVFNRTSAPSQIEEKESITFETPAPRKAEPASPSSYKEVAPWQSQQIDNVDIDELLKDL